MLGLLAVGVGLVAWVLPFVPGVPLVVLGLGLLGAASPGLRGAINTAERRLPHRWRIWMRPGLGKVSPRSPAAGVVDNLFR